MNIGPDRLTSALVLWSFFVFVAGAIVGVVFRSCYSD